LIFFTGQVQEAQGGQDRLLREEEAGVPGQEQVQHTQVQAHRPFIQHRLLLPGKIFLYRVATVLVTPYLRFIMMTTMDPISEPNAEST
jgi:hypothetical protein